MSDCPFAIVRNAHRDTALRAWNQRVTFWSRSYCQQILVYVDIGLSMASMLFVSYESEMPYTRTLCHLLKEDDARRSFEHVFWVTALPRLRDK